MARYGLANHVFVCRDEEYIVVLDVRQDRYFALEAARTAALLPLLPGWPAQGAVDPTGVAIGADEAAEPLLRQGWLLESSEPGATGKDATPPQVTAPQTELSSGLETVATRIGTRTLLAFVVSSVFAKLALRFWRFERVIRRVSERKRARGDAAVDLERARVVVEAFTRLRAFLFSHREECLHDSLALLEFLARYEVFPNWVFAVRARPFEAHCWVQYQDVVFNDTAEHAAGYKPIMVV